MLASNLTAMAASLETMVSNLLAMASNLVLRNSFHSRAAPQPRVHTSEHVAKQRRRAATAPEARSIYDYYSS